MRQLHSGTATAKKARLHPAVLPATPMGSVGFRLDHQFRKAKSQSPSHALTRDRAPGNGLAQRRLGHPNALRSLGNVQKAIREWRSRYLFANDGTNPVQNRSNHAGLARTRAITASTTRDRASSSCDPDETRRSCATAGRARASDLPSAPRPRPAPTALGEDCRNLIAKFWSVPSQKAMRI
jgi:hypothetical protein